LVPIENSNTGNIKIAVSAATHLGFWRYRFEVCWSKD